MDINRANMNTLFTGFKMNFQSGMEQARKDYEAFSTVLMSNAAIENYPFLEQFSGMREWLGDREVKNLAGKKLELANRDFEDTIRIRANDVKDDAYGVYAPLIQELGVSSENIWSELAIEAMLAGETEKWIDSKVFFATDRKYGKSTISNKSTSALSAESYKAARAAMFAYAGHNGKKLAVRPSLLLVGPSNEDAAFDVLNNELVIAGKTVESTVVGGAVGNPWAKTSSYIVLPELDNEWFLLDVSHAIKPLIVQKREEAKLVSMTDDNDENVFMRNEYVYGAQARGAAALTFPHLIYGSFPA